ncbi:Anti-sigma-F factor antagonist RsfB [Marinomonas gallaica]|uniref:Anti-sigma-F factor antagonist RsfB n=1 Tax=Marinomonas gallaica TaxID=1806667 RepID=A0A1C3JUB1_9GAMM|nr:STAS domain-containing protein [Marinomonas gallaica]SBT18803.1 Anti-sigma-F factor antagonist RsfB [Marinomonas gallaica]SBT21758.1 Anti-sigma-F factor antagonist RsfB [Marinomonas gallaica]
MSITVTEYKNKGMVEISVVGSFDFSLFNDFKEAYEQFVDSRYKHFTIDIESVEYLDSAALGMLLSMKASLGENVDIKIAGANGFIRNILMISRFDKRFTIV